MVLSMPWAGDTYEETLVPSAARTTSSQIVSGEDFGSINQLRAQLNVTAASGTTPNLVVTVESTLDGTNWDAQGTFTAKTAVGRETIAIQNWVGRQLRVRWAITGTTPSFTFEVRIQAERAR